MRGRFVAALDAQPCQMPALGLTHRGALVVRGVVVADQMQRAVNDVQEQLVLRRPADLVSHAAGRIGTDDHFAIELEYPSGARILSMCRQQDGTSRYVGERFLGTRGRAVPSDRNPSIEGAQAWRWAGEGEPVNPYVQEHTNLVSSIRAGTPLNEAKRVAESTLTAILAREAAYTGQEITWDEISASDLDLTPGPMAFGPVPFPPVAEPGVTKLSRPPFGHAHETLGG